MTTPTDAAIRAYAADLIRAYVTGFDYLDLAEHMADDDTIDGVYVADLVAGVADVRWLLEQVEQLRAERDWQPGRWRQVRQPDGSLWMETSDGDEAEAEARKQGWPLYRLWECHDTEWRLEADAAPQQPERAACQSCGRDFTLLYVTRYENGSTCTDCAQQPERGADADGAG